MEKLLFVIIITIFLFSPQGIKAAETYTKEEVASHETSDDCYMIFENKVYDISDMRLKIHEKYQDILSWCGKDITKDYKTKDSMGEDHIDSTYELLETYYIGNVVASDATSNSGNDTSKDEQIVQETEEATQRKSTNPYSYYPVLVTAILLVGMYIISKSRCGREIRFFSRPMYDFIWTTVMIIGLIPSFGFGLFMIAGYSYPELRNIDANILYWHVTGSQVFATAIIMHLILRLKQYVAPVKGLLLLRKQSESGTRKGN